MGSRPCPPPWLPSPERGARRGEEPGGDRGSERSRDPGEELRERGSEAEVGRRGTVACPAGWLGGCPFPAPAYQGRSDRQHLGGSHGPTSLPSPWPPAALASPPRGAEACACRFRPRPDSLGSGPSSGPGSATPAVWPRASGSASLGLACQVAFRHRTSKSGVGQKLAGDGPLRPSSASAG